MPLAGTVLTSGYKCNLLSILATKTYEPAIETVDDIVKRDLTVFMLKDALSTEMAFERSTLPLRARVYQEHVVDRGGLFTIKTLRAVRRRLLAEKDTASMWDGVYRLMDGHLFHYSRERLAFMHTAYIFPKNLWFRVTLETLPFKITCQQCNDFQPMMSKLIDRIKAAGIYDHLKVNYLRSLQGSSWRRSKLASQNNRLKLEAIFTTFGSLVVGWIVALLAFIVERLGGICRPLPKLSSRHI